MVTDRCTTASLLVYLAHASPFWMPWIQFLIALDFSSHYCQMVSSLTLGSASHKKLSKTSNILLRLYYENSIMLFFVCAGNEVFYMSCYLSLFYTNSLIYGLKLTCLPIFLFKQVLNLLQLKGATQELVNFEKRKYR
jgi:CDP-diacylglycerol--inositol 3-phosphatidyltransferase